MKQPCNFEFSFDKSYQENYLHYQELMNQNADKLDPHHPLSRSNISRAYSLFLKSYEAVKKEEKKSKRREG